jgi:hypothetical protein
MVRRFGGAGEWFTFGGASALLGTTFIGFSTGAGAWSGLAWIGWGVLGLGVLVCLAGIGVWVRNVRAAVAQEAVERSAKDVGALSPPAPAESPQAPLEARVKTGATGIRPALSDYYREEATDNPLAAILKAWLAVEGWLDRELPQFGLSTHDGQRKRSVREMTRLMVDRGVLPASAVPTVDGLGVMRDIAADKGGEGSTAEDARHYLTLVDGTMLMLDRALFDWKMHNGYDD